MQHLETKKMFLLKGVVNLNIAQPRWHMNEIYVQSTDVITDGEERKYSEINLSQYHSDHHKSHINCLGVKPALREFIQFQKQECEQEI
jgi:hypothetical protein